MNVTTTRAPRARKNDPQESHEAAAAVDALGVARIKRNIIRILADYPCHDERLVARYAVRSLLPLTTDSSIRSRRAELVRAGAVRATGEHARTAHGRPTRIWEINPDNPQVQAVLAMPEANQ